MGKGGKLMGPWGEPYKGFAGQLMGQLGSGLGMEGLPLGGPDHYAMESPGAGYVQVGTGPLGIPKWQKGITSSDVAKQQAGLQQAFAPHPLESLAGLQMMGFNPASYFAGAEGALGKGLEQVGQASKLATTPDQFGGGDVLKRTLGADFLNVMSDPAIQARNMALQQQAMGAIQQALPQLQTGVQQATGGVGVGSALGQQQGRLASNVLGGLTQQLAQLGGQDLARREAIQQGAMGTALQHPLQQASLLGQLGMGQAGLGADIGGQQMGAYLQNLAGMGGLGNILAQRGIGQFMAPYEMALNFLGMAQGTPVQGGGGFGSFLGGLGKMAGGIGKIARG